MPKVMPLTSEQHESAEVAREISQTRIGWLLRLVLCGLGITLLGLLVVARTLDPNPDGVGTHRQLLELPPCGFLAFFGVPCPACGMTTSWAHFTRGQFANSLQANAGGLLLALFVLPVGIWLTISGWRGRWSVVAPNPLILALALAAIIAVSLIQWAIRIG